MRSNGQKKKQKRYALEGALALLVACGFDVLGEPPSPLHPVVWYGYLIRWLQGFAPRGSRAQLVYGILMPLLATGIVCPFALLLQKVVNWFYSAVRRWYGPRIAFVGSTMLLGGMLKPFFAWRMLAGAGKSVRVALEQQDLPEAREALRSLVSRDRTQLSEELAAAAAVESLAENMSDSVVAPLFYYTLFGLPGAMLYRLINTFDSMIGYHDQYEYLGKASARLDDLLNFIPARLTSVFIIVLAPFYGGESGRACRIWLRDRYKTESPNAGQPMAAAAGALGIQLEKAGSYCLGDAEHMVGVLDIKRAERLVGYVGAIAVVCTMLTTYLWKSKCHV
ncbi:adenosylcobinamide-phosphate synthase CbiB [Dictyobacter aurantiacus]|uniref:Cobalamin biosynthesis protein CobD n=1 Tax=Dictyobacter aurantiacus TaxID=1936993 RepID=A0A401Z944_9CHLR|nr:adenosylcobinamide-phosphate synthase CbiB [Dictyobacter aurantiacus]GCE03338.1 cobalamin biosynthesis protein CobD [Dictyobacter aurantiacus]